MAKQTLEEQMMQSLAGDQRVYQGLLLEISKMVRAYISKKISSPTDVEDITQEVLCSIHKARHTYDGARPLKPWVFAIATYRLNDFLRKAYKRNEHEAVDYDSVENYLGESVTDEDSSNELLDIVAQLPERDKQIVLMMKVEGYSAKEVAHKLDMSVSAVKVAAHRAYKKLKIMIDEIERKA